MEEISRSVKLEFGKVVVVVVVVGMRGGGIWACGNFYPQVNITVYCWM